MITMITLGRHGSFQQTLSRALNTTGLYNDYTFRSMLQAQEIRLRSPDRLSPRGVWSGHEITEKQAMYAGNGGPTKPDGYFLTPFMPKLMEMASQCRPRPFYRGAQTQPCCLHPPGAPTHLPLSRPFCCRRTYLPRTLPEVT